MLTAGTRRGAKKAYAKKRYLVFITRLSRYRYNVNLYSGFFLCYDGIKQDSKSEKKGVFGVTDSKRERADRIAENFHIPRWEQLPSIDLYMDQVVAFIDGRLGDFFACTGTVSLTKSMVNNYVKSKIVDAPVNKKYPRLSVAMIVVVCILKNCYATEEIGKLIRLGISLENTEVTYDRFCEAVENAVRLVFRGEVHVKEEAIPGRDNKYLMENFALSFASKMYVQCMFLYPQNVPAAGRD